MLFTILPSHWLCSRFSHGLLLFVSLVSHWPLFGVSLCSDRNHLHADDEDEFLRNSSFGKIVFVDLAGSERLKETGSEGCTLLGTKSNRVRDRVRVRGRLGSGSGSGLGLRLGLGLGLRVKG